MNSIYLKTMAISHIVAVLPTAPMSVHCVNRLGSFGRRAIFYSLPLRKPLFRKLSVPAVSPVHRVLCLQAVEELPPKLQNIVKLFGAVSEPRSKYEQLLHYGKNMNPLAKEFQTKENKVEGCVSQVWVRAYMEDTKVYYEADSDSVLTKGLAALLVEGLSGCSPAEILGLTPDFIQMLGLKQSLTPSRNNGFLNMLKLMQRKALKLYMEAESAGNSNVVNPQIQNTNGVHVLPPKEETEMKHQDGFDEKDNSVAVSVESTRADRIRQKLETELEPMVLEIDDVSYQHAGHAAVSDEARETHFNVKIVSSKFEGRSLVKRHRFIYDLLQEELQSGLHALSITAKTPAEMESM